jgi:uncharacterized protein
MKRWMIAAAIVAVLALAAASEAPAKTAVPALETSINRGVVELETSRSASISVRIAEDLANIIDDGATRRVLPVVGQGPLQNLTDLMLLRGIDMAIMHVDVLDYALQQNFTPSIEHSVTYITRLYNEEFHVLAGQDVKDVAGLANQTVNTDLRGAGTAITATRIFDLLRIPVTTTNDDQEVALEKLRKGEIAAVAYVAGKPAPIFRQLNRNDGFHFLSIRISPTVTTTYVPTRLTAADYPGLVSPDHVVDTVAVGAVLVAANFNVKSERYRNLANFVEAFFTGFQALLDPGHHPKWSEVNIAAELPGWRRFPPAEQWLQRNAQTAGAPAPQDLKAFFSRFIDERQKATDGLLLTQQQKDELFRQFQLWQGGQHQ